MNPALSAAEMDALLEVLDRGIVGIRWLAGRGDAKRAEDVADALQNVPRLVNEGQKRGWTLADFRSLFLTPLVERYPDLAWLEEPLNEIESRRQPAA
jgi:hypothetical protein